MTNSENWRRREVGAMTTVNKILQFQRTLKPHRKEKDPIRSQHPVGELEHATYFFFIVRKLDME